MIVGIGIDLIEIERIDRALRRFSDRFTRRILHETEIHSLKEHTASARITAERIAARFAAKEAAVKALGTGFTRGITLHDLRITSLPSGSPQISFHGAALARAETLGVDFSHLSLSHARQSACAVVILETLANSAPGFRNCSENNPL